MEVAPRVLQETTPSEGEFRRVYTPRCCHTIPPHHRHPHPNPLREASRLAREDIDASWRPSSHKVSPLSRPPLPLTLHADPRYRTGKSARSMTRSS